MSAFQVLFVDDLADIRLLTAMGFRRFRAEWHVIEADNGETALQFCMDAMPDVVIMNIHMPVMDGLEALAILRETPEIAHIPVVIHTAAGYLEDDAYDAGADLFLVKPITPDKLVEAIESLFSSY